MKKVVLVQRFQFYTIEPYRDFSHTQNRVENQIHNDLDVDLENVDFFTARVVSPKDEQELFAILRDKFRIQLHNKNELKRKNTKYYYSEKSNGEDIMLERWSNKVPSFYTTKERHLLKHYGRPFSSVSTEIHERNITIDGDSISVRFYVYKKIRTVNNKFFKKTRSAFGFKINLKTGNIISYEGTKTPKIRQNNFKHLQYVLTLFFGRTCGDIVYGYNDRMKNHPINLEAKKIFDNNEFIKSLTHLFLSKLPHNINMLSNNEENVLNKTFFLISEAFITINKIKVPNNYQKLLMDAYPTKQFLKKNDNKLIVSVLDRIGIKSKSTIKLVHKYPEMDLRRLMLLCRYFGYSQMHKYIHNINEKFFSEPNKNSNDMFLGTVYQGIINKFEYDIKDSERKCLLKLMNEFFESVENEQKTTRTDVGVTVTQFNTFNDHLDLLTKIRNHLPDIEMRATNLMDFHHEHLELSKIDRAIKKGYSIKYVFEDKLIEHIEDPIYVLDDYGNITQTYYPVLLKIDGEYTEEGAHMHHCVATYADRERSLIVSIREGSIYGNERVTCEFNTTDKSLVQAKYFCNAVPPERFEFALEKLNHRIKIFRGSIKSLSKEKVPLVINGVQIPTKEENEDDFFIRLINADNHQF